MRAQRAVILVFVVAVACAAPRVTSKPAAPSPAVPVTPRPSPAAGGDAATSPLTGERPIPELGRPWGTAGPLALVAASPERRWLAFCQARADTDGDGKLETRVSPRGEVQGDRLEGFFADEPGEGMRIDSFGGADPSGRFVAYVREGRLVLRDTTTRVDAALDADLRDDQAPFVHPRFVAFDGTGERLLYPVRAGEAEALRVRDLSTGAERAIDVGAGSLYRADFDPSGRYVVFSVVPRDAAGGARAEWPAPPAVAPWMRCSAPLPRYPVWERPAGELVQRVAPVDGSRGWDTPGLVVPFGKDVVVRAADGALELLSEDGKTAPLVKKECSAHVVHVDATRGILLVTCAKKKKSSHPELVLVRGGSATPLGFEVSGTFGDRWLDGAPRLVPLYPGPDTILFDADQARTETLSPGDRVLSTNGTRALVERGTGLLFHELGGVETKLPGTVSPLARILRTKTTLAVPPLVVSLAGGELIGTTDVHALAIAVDGAGLVPERVADAAAFAHGPLSWKALGPISPADPAK